MVNRALLAKTTLAGLIAMIAVCGWAIKSEVAEAAIRVTGQTQVELWRQQQALSLITGSTVDGDWQVAPAATGGIQPISNAATTNATDSQQAAPSPIDTAFWDLSRATGFSAYLLLVLNIVLGIAMRSQSLGKALPPWRSLDLHQFTALLGLVFLSAHALALLGDQYANFTLGQLLIPFTGSYRPLAVGFGIIAGYLLLLVQGSSFLRDLIGRQMWRALHYYSWCAYVVALLHCLLSGTDSGEPWAAVIYWSTAIGIPALVLGRLAVGANSIAASSSIE